MTYIYLLAKFKRLIRIPKKYAVTKKIFDQMESPQLPL